MSEVAFNSSGVGMRTCILVLGHARKGRTRRAEVFLSRSLEVYSAVDGEEEGGGVRYSDRRWVSKRASISGRHVAGKT